MKKSLLFILLPFLLQAAISHAQCGANVNQPADQTIRSGSATEAVNLSPNNYSTSQSWSVNWTNSNPTIGLPSSGIGNVPSFIATNNSSGPITGAINVVPTMISASSLVTNQQQLTDALGMNMNETDNPFGFAQSFIPTSNTICGTSVLWRTYGGSGVSTIGISLWTNLPSKGGQKLAEGFVSASSGTLSTVLWNPVTVMSGSTYYFVVTSSDKSFIVSVSQNNSYTNGSLYFTTGNGNFSIYNTIDAYFKVYSSGDLTTCSGSPQTFNVKVNPITPDAHGIIYVKKGSTGAGNSWASAIGEVADALKAAKTNTAIKQIWVAAGTYLPLYSPADNNFGTNQGRNNAFLLVNNVKLYGGFAGTETAITGRVANTNTTILSGDFNGNDVVTGSGSTLSIINNTENAYNVLISSGAVGTALVDGFTIKGGNANNSSGSITVNSNTILQYYGGGMFNYSSSPVLTNVTLSGNTATTYGGGMFNQSSSSPVLSNVTLSGNTATQGYGGGMFNFSSSPVLTNVTLSGNRAAYGGGMLNSSSSPVLTNVILSGNTALQGGGIYNQSSSPVLTNVTLSGNTATNGHGGGMLNSSSSPVLTNATFYGNSPGAIFADATGTTVNNSLIYGNTAGIETGSAAITQNYSLIQGINSTANGNIAGTTDPQFNNPTTGDFTLKQTSPAINAGSNALFTGLTATTTDLAGNPRVYNFSSGGIIDMGAYEYQGDRLVPTITFNAISVKTVGDADFTISVISTNNAVPVTFASSNTAVATVTGNTVHIVSAGTTVITASQAGDVNHAAAADVQQTLTVVPARQPQTIAFNTQTSGSTVNATYGDASINGAVTTSSGLAPAYASSNPAVAQVDNNGQVTIRSAGTTTITANQAGDVNHTAATPISFVLTVQQKALTITANNKSKAFGTALTGGPDSTAFTYAGLVNSETIGSVIIIYGTGAAAGAPANTYTGSVVANAATGGTFTPTNYTITYVAGNIIVGQAVLTITANNTIKTYGSSVPTLTVSYSGFIGTDDASSLTIAPTISTPAAANSPVNTYPVTASGAVSSNYTFVYQPGTLTVTPAALTITANNKSKAFGTALTGGPGSTAFTYAGLVNSETIGSVTITYGTGAAAGAPANTYTGSVVASAATGGTFTPTNYAITYVAGNIIVGQAVLTITANSTIKTYGSPVPTLTVSYSGFIGTDDASGLTTQPTISTTAVPNSPVNTYPITVNGAVSSNYTIVYQPGTLTVTPAALTITASNRNKIYGQTLTGGAGSTAFTPTGLVGTETIGSVTIAYGTGAAAADAANTYTDAIVPSAATGGTFNNANYTISYIAGNITVGKAPITVTADAQTKVYGAADPVLTFKITSGALQFADTFTGALTRVAGESAGTYAIQQGTLALSSNYALTYTGANLTIGKTAITVTADIKSKTYGDADPALTYTITSGALAGTDAFTGTLIRDAGENAGSYAIKQGTLALGSNYTLTYTDANLTIGAKAIAVTADAKTKTFGEADPALTYKITSGALVGTDAFTGALTRDAGETVGTYAIKQGTLDLSSNYTISYVAGILKINGAVLTITADNQAKVYGQANPALTASYSGFVNGDTEASLTTKPTLITTATASSAVNTYGITASGAAIPNYTIVYVPDTLTVSKAVLTVTADNKSRNYGVANPALTVAYSGFVNGDDVTKLTSPATATTTAALSTAPGTYAITPGGAASGNYSFTYVNGTLTIIALTNADLNALTISSGTLSPVFATGTLTYQVSVENTVDNIRLTPTFDPTATASINGTSTANGSPSFAVPLNVGDNQITLVVTAQDGVTKNTYAVNVYRGKTPVNISATNILTPNGDGKNDYWIIQDILLYPNNNVAVYDKAGRTVYSKHGYTNDWDGSLKGAPLNEGTYYYIVALGPGLPSFKGYITLLRSH